MAKEVVICGIKVATTLHGDYVVVLTDSSGRIYVVPVGDQAQPFPQETTSPYQLKVSVDKDNVGLATESSLTSELTRRIKAYDGTTYRDVLVDSDGHLQVDIVDPVEPTLLW